MKDQHRLKLLLVSAVLITWSHIAESPPPPLPAPTPTPPTPTPTPLRQPSTSPLRTSPAQPSPLQESASPLSSTLPQSTPPSTSTPSTPLTSTPPSLPSTSPLSPPPSTPPPPPPSFEPLPPYNKGDVGGTFLHSIPERYRNSTVGPATYQWIVSLFGVQAAHKNNIRRAPSDSHVCGEDGWCRPLCRPTETKDWLLKDVCGAFICCHPTLL